MNFSKVLPLVSLLFLLSGGLSGQEFPHELPEYPFILYPKNTIKFYGDSSGFEQLYRKFDQVIFEGDSQVNVLHMGGSHVQAGVFSSRMREHLQSIQPGLNSYRGFLFPFRLAATNNPENYIVRYTGEWSSCRNVEKKKDCTLGLAGISATTQSENASLKISFHPDYIDQPFKSVKIYHPGDSSLFDIEIEASDYTLSDYPELGFSEISFQSQQDSILIHFVKNADYQDHFTLLGLQFASEDTGFAYHAVGVNGADVPSYLRCELLAQHAKSLDLDLVVFGIGINDATNRYFNPETFKTNYGQLIAELREGNPEINIIFITNNDSYYRRRYPNENAFKVQQAMKELAVKYNAGVWDLFEIMGGLDSISQWQSLGLAQSDKIHFTRAGYKLVGDLFFSALIRSYEYHIKSTFQN